METRLSCLWARHAPPGSAHLIIQMLNDPYFNDFFPVKWLKFSVYFCETFEWGTELWQFALFNSSADVFSLWTWFIWIWLHQQNVTSLIIHPFTIAPCSSQSSCDFMNVWLFFTCVLFMSSPGGAGLHVQSDRGDRSSDDAQGLRYSRMGGQLGSHHISRVHEVLQRCLSRGNSALAVKPETNIETSAQMGASAETDYIVTHAQAERSVKKLGLICFL